MYLLLSRFISYTAKQTSCQRAVPLLLALLSLHACGFQLRGAMDLSQDISPVYLQQNEAFELARELKSQLQANKISLVDYANMANTRLVITRENKAQRVLSVDSSGRAKEYLITYTVNFTVKIKQQEATEESVAISRSLLFDTEAVLAVSNEAEVLYADMKRDAARLILMKLQARARNAAAEKPITEEAEKPSGDAAVIPDKP
jgi:LPS-assembly lipoprotein